MGRAFCLSVFSPRSLSSYNMHASYADSSRPGPRARWTAIAAPMTISVILFNSIVISCLLSLSSTFSAFSAVNRFLSFGSGEQLSHALYETYLGCVFADRIHADVSGVFFEQAGVRH